MGDRFGGKGAEVEEVRDAIGGLLELDADAEELPGAVPLLLASYLFCKEDTFC